MSCNSEAPKLDPENNSANYLKNSHNNENTIYNILSIDGGGIRGVLPALWLSEIEYRTHRLISHLFNMMTGTSIGGIITAGLSAPQFKPAPTFFPPYEIGNKTFIDGGIYLNNPASTAYSEAIKYNVTEKNISVLSLVLLEEPIELDDHKCIPDLLELGYQYIEELDSSDENPINKLVESFDSVL
ncbi:18224_t:CDS:2 [Cetraspora pellucida]|uniref:18224_t:CDS:1 n=1 Tax=Cetraspora pellucida TaxID=1433469 RepID=A0ACA9LAT9_9GLOM|nr:18224_t:CDS:2 [Cetraspora pellucida]